MAHEHHRIPAWVQSARIQGNAKALAGYLNSLQSIAGVGVAFKVSQETMAERLCVNIKTVRRCLDHLVKIQALRVVKGVRQGNRNECDRYHFDASDPAKRVTLARLKESRDAKQKAAHIAASIMKRAGAPITPAAILHAADPHNKSPLLMPQK